MKHNSIYFTVIYLILHASCIARTYIGVGWRRIYFSASYLVVYQSCIHTPAPDGARGSGHPRERPRTTQLHRLSQT